jgi:hypothetical protein
LPQFAHRSFQLSLGFRGFGVESLALLVPAVDAFFHGCVRVQ